MSESRGAQVKGVCCMCSYPGTVELLRTSLDPGETGIFFPSLITHTNVTKPQKFVQACVLCAELMREQWKMQESRLIPVAKRKYWTKAWAPDVNCSSDDPNPLAAVKSEPEELNPISSQSCPSPGGNRVSQKPDGPTGTEQQSGSRPKITVSEPNPDEIIASFLRNQGDPAALAMLLMKQSTANGGVPPANMPNVQELIRWIQQLQNSSLPSS